MNKIQQYRWSINTSNVYSFMMFNYAGTLASYKNEVSGWISKPKVMELLTALKNSGKQYSNFKLVTSTRFWKHYDHYNN